MRRLNRFKPRKEKENPLFRVYQTVSFWRTLKNTIVIEFCRYFPWISGKRKLYRSLLRMEIGENTAVAFKVTFDLFYPEKIKIGRNSIIGFHTTILTHEYLVEEYRTGEVQIGDDTMIGANVTILPGVTIGSRVKVGAGAVVNRDIPDDHLAFGNPLVVRPLDRENKRD
ncbi:acyltransferase [Listeria valentina]|uniref:acyltransferase n=1 Tax=Listeria valentina TaxID=2705293 RepID=UPI0014319F4D|nr:acyltransferase [Listeria valentina]